MNNESIKPVESHPRGFWNGFLGGFVVASLLLFAASFVRGGGSGFTATSDRSAMLFLSLGIFVFAGLSLPFSSFKKGTTRFLIGAMLVATICFVLFSPNLLNY